jgi:hypothetical protein
MNTTENTKVWEAPLLIIQLLECTESKGSPDAVETDSYYPISA